MLALAAIAIMNQAGGLTRVDQFALDHLMPWLDARQKKINQSSGFYVPFNSHSNWWSRLLDLWTYPCSVLLSALVVGGVGAYLWRCGRRAAALVPAAAWVIGNGIEVIGKGTITRPALYGAAGGVRLHVVNFDDSFPSGHMIRGTIVAAAVVLVWRRSAWWVALWLLFVGPALVVAAAHTPTDVVGGALVGAILVLAGRETIRWLEQPKAAGPGTMRSSGRGPDPGVAGTARGG